jgi:hypothetical protein
MRLRGLIAAAVLAVAGVAIGFFITRFLTPTPSPLIASQSSQTMDGRPVVNITFTTVGAVGGGEHPNWVAYLDPNGNPDTFFHVPAGSVVHMTIDQQDSATGLRNEYFGLIRGTLGSDGTTDSQPVANVQCDPSTVKDPSIGKKNCGTLSAIDPTHAAHTFTPPARGVRVPRLGVSRLPSTPRTAQNVVSFYFFAPTTPGEYRWQCFVPCGAGTLYGNGGPMQTLGYMAGEMQVTPQ